MDGRFSHSPEHCAAEEEPGFTIAQQQQSVQGCDKSTHSASAQSTNSRYTGVAVKSNRHGPPTGATCPKNQNPLDGFQAPRTNTAERSALTGTPANSFIEPRGWTNTTTASQVGYLPIWWTDDG